MSLNQFGEIRRYLSAPLILLSFYLLILQIGNVLYAAREIPASTTFEWLNILGFWSIIYYWLRLDARKNRFGWFLDLGFFLYLAWIFIIPYYLFKTRGSKAFIPILFFIGLFTASYLLSLIVYFLII